jgi:hypothetical protein
MAFRVVRRAFSRIGTGDNNALKSMEEGASSINVNWENNALLSPHMNQSNLASTEENPPIAPPKASSSQRRQQDEVPDTPTKVRIVENSSPLVMRVSTDVISSHPASISNAFHRVDSRRRFGRRSTQFTMMFGERLLLK